jgi:hypothetical protein
MSLTITHYHLTLGELADALDALPPNLPIPCLCAPHSYRGWYEHIAFEVGTPSLARDVAALVRAQIGARHHGYKGGTYTMTRDTPVWLASRGELGRRVVGLTDDGHVILEPEEPEVRGRWWEDDET